MYILINFFRILLILQAVPFIYGGLVGDTSRFIYFHWKTHTKFNEMWFQIFPYDQTFSQMQNQALTLFYFPQEDSWTQATWLQKQILFSQSLSNPIDILLTNLKQDTQYYYLLDVDGNLMSQMDFFLDFKEKFPHDFYEFRTYVQDGQPFSFNLAFGSCARTGSDSDVFLSLRKRISKDQTLFFYQTGDFVYSDIYANDVNKFEIAFQRVFRSKLQNHFYQHIPVNYIWDDHDFGINNAGYNNPAQQAAYLTYSRLFLISDINLNLTFVFFLHSLDFTPIDRKEYIATPGKQEGIYTSYIVGRVFVLRWDCRSFFIDKVQILGSTQVEWIQNELDEVQKRDYLTTILIISSIPWIGGSWELAVKQKSLVGDLFEEIQSIYNRQVLMITGDHHMAGFAHAKNNKIGNFPVVVSGPMDQRTTCKGGTWTYGPNMVNNNYGNVEFDDQPELGRTCIRVTGYHLDDTLFLYDSCDPLIKDFHASNQCDIQEYIKAILALVSCFGYILLLVIAYMLYSQFCNIFPRAQLHLIEQARQNYFNQLEDKQRNKLIEETKVKRLNQHESQKPSLKIDNIYELGSENLRFSIRNQQSLNLKEKIQNFDQIIHQHMMLK